MLWSLHNPMVMAANTIKNAMAHNEKHRISNKPHTARMCSDTGRALEQIVKKACGARNIVKLAPGLSNLRSLWLLARDLNHSSHPPSNIGHV